MKRIFKYGLLVVMLLLLHSVTMKAVATVDPSAEASAVASAEASAEAVQEACFLSQAHAEECPAFNRFYTYYSTMPCELGHADVSHVPTDKSFVRLFTRFREHRAMNGFFSDDLLHPSIYSSSDPVDYYVFGLRKIII